VSPRPGTFADVAEHFRTYWEADGDDDFRRADWRARRALYRYARRLAEVLAKRGTQRAATVVRETGQRKRKVGGELG
jgi:hypothetical protein